MSDVGFLPPALRWVLVALAVLAGGAAALSYLARKSRPRLERLVVPLCVGAVCLLFVVAVERLAGLILLGMQPPEGEYNEVRWVLRGPWGTAGIVAGVLAVVASLLLSLRGTRREKRLPRRALLGALRAGALTAALVLFLEPALELRHVTREPNHIAVLVDDSLSMDLAEKPDGATRAERAAQIIRNSAATFEAWRRRHVVDFYTFSDTVAGAAETDLAQRVAPRADATLLREALEIIRSRHDGDDLAGVIVVSDGVPTGRFAAGADDGGSVEFLKSLKTRVHAAWAGRKGLRDLSVAAVYADEFAFVRTVLKVEALVRATGVEKRSVPVTLKRNGEIVKMTRVTVGGDTPEARAVFAFTPERVGKYVYEISVPIDAGETITTNNARAFVLRVIRDKIRVLQVAGRPSWDERALRGFLKADPNVDLISFFILRTPDDLQLVPSHEMSLIPFPTEELFEQELGSFDLIVFMNFEYGPYQIGPYLENVRRYVEAGGAFAMVGGDLSFSSGQYFGTPLGEALPVELLPASPRPLFRGLDPDGRPTQVYADDPLLSVEEFRPRLTGEGARHPITRLRFDRSENEALWKRLPPLEGLNIVQGARPGATVLLEHPRLTARGKEPMPVLVSGSYGEGRTVALLTDTTWRWWFAPAGTSNVDPGLYDKLWENIIRWLIRDPELDYLHVEADQIEYGPGEAPRLVARLVDKDYRPAAGAEITLVVEPAPGAADGGKRKKVEKKLETGESGEVTLDLAPPDPGAWRVRASARMGRQRITAEDLFLVSPQRAELAEPEAREDTLVALADVTGGEYLGGASRLDADLAFAPPRVVRVDRRTDVELWSRPYLFVLALLFLGLEWAIRRKSGYL